MSTIKIPEDKINKMRRYIYNFNYKAAKYHPAFRNSEIIKFAKKSIENKSDRSIAKEYFRIKQYSLSETDKKDIKKYNIKYKKY